MAKTKKLDKREARKMAEDLYKLDFKKDFFAQTNTSISDGLVGLSKLVGYKKPKSASGSTARYFFEYLAKVK